MRLALGVLGWLAERTQAGFWPLPDLLPRRDRVREVAFLVGRGIMALKLTGLRAQKMDNGQAL